MLVVAPVATFPNLGAAHPCSRLNIHRQALPNSAELNHALACAVWLSASPSWSPSLAQICDAFVLHLFAALAEKERRLISERTRAGLAAAKARRQVLGNPKLAEIRADVNARRSAEADACTAGGPGFCGDARRSRLR